MFRIVIFILCVFSASAQDLDFRPMPRRRTVIWYNHSDKGNVLYWQNELNKFLQPYNRSNNPHVDNLETCRQFQRPSPGKVCDVKIDHNWSPCTEEAGFNFESSQGGPCIFLKLVNILNWVPQYFNATTIEYDTGGMGRTLKRIIMEANFRDEHQVVWVTCEGQNPADKEHIGPVRYIPQRGFPSQYFPYQNQDGYLSPLVAVYFERPRRGVIINIECKAWAKNIIHDGVNGRGYVLFQLMID